MISCILYIHVQTTGKASYSYIRLANSRIRYVPREYYKRYMYVNTPRECDTRYANTLWAARIRYAIREYAIGRARDCDTRYANTLRAARIRYAIRETRMGYALRAKVVYIQKNCLTDRRQTQQAIQQDHELAQMQTQLLSPTLSCDVLAWIQIFPPPPHQLLPWRN